MIVVFSNLMIVVLNSLMIVVISKLLIPQVVLEEVEVLGEVVEVEEVITGNHQIQHQVLLEVLEHREVQVEQMLEQVDKVELEAQEVQVEIGERQDLLVLQEIQEILDLLAIITQVVLDHLGDQETLEEVRGTTY
jgi:hypothetical protein